MGDTTNVTLITYDVPAKLQPHVLDAFHDCTFNSWDYDIGHLGAEGRVGSASEVDESLQAMIQQGVEIDCPTCEGASGTKGAPDCAGCDNTGQTRLKGEFAYQVWEDPKYEFLGSLYMYAPGLGRYTADCDAEGNAVFPERSVLALITDATDLAQLKLDAQAMFGAEFIAYFRDRVPG